jgi:hypothetical protein
MPSPALCNIVPLTRPAIGGVNDNINQVNYNPTPQHVNYTFQFINPIYQPQTNTIPTINHITDQYISTKFDAMYDFVENILLLYVYYLDVSSQCDHRKYLYLELMLSISQILTKIYKIHYARIYDTPLYRYYLVSNAIKLVLFTYASLVMRYYVIGMDSALLCLMIYYTILIIYGYKIYSPNIAKNYDVLIIYGGILVIQLLHNYTVKTIC